MTKLELTFELKAIAMISGFATGPINEKTIILLAERLDKIHKAELKQTAADAYNAGLGQVLETEYHCWFEDEKKQYLKQFES